MAPVISENNEERGSSVEIIATISDNIDQLNKVRPGGENSNQDKSTTIQSDLEESKPGSTQNL